MRKLIAKLTENARLFAETRKLLGGKVLEVVEDEQERAPEIAAEFYPASANGSPSNGSKEEPSLPGHTTQPKAESSPPQNNSASNGGNGSARSGAIGATSPPARSNGNNGNGSHGSSSFNRLRNELLATARRVATRKNQAIGEVVEWASGGAFKYGDIGRMTEADIPILLAAAEVMMASLPGIDR